MQKAMLSSEKKVKDIVKLVLFHSLCTYHFKSFCVSSNSGSPLTLNLSL
ncbi:hypothetical protein DAI22_04g286900 [Oryza sativa Japonica Group]|nr:hypothetical protein DAI22_04g286900 [Oryza sativa Japonica Group]